MINLKRIYQKGHKKLHKIHHRKLQKLKNQILHKTHKHTKIKHAHSNNKIPNNKQTFGYETFEENVSNEGKFIETIKSELDITAQRHIYKILFFFRCKDTNKIAKCKIYKYDENNISCYLKIIQDSVSDEEKILCANDTQELTNKIIKAIRQYNKLEYIENVFMIDNNFI